MNPPRAELFSAAAHEAAHGVAFKAAGIPIYHVKLWTKGDFAHGECRIDQDNIPDRQAFLIAILAGQEGQARWLVKRGGWWTLAGARQETESVSACPTDLKEFKRRSKGTGFDESHVRSKAQQFVATHWGKIEQLGNKLAKDGKLPVSAL